MNLHFLKNFGKKLALLFKLTQAILFKTFFYGVIFISKFIKLILKTLIERENECAMVQILEMRKLHFVIKNIFWLEAALDK